MKKLGKNHKLSLKKAVELCTGANSWYTREYKDCDIPALCMCDGPHGLRKQEDGGGGFSMLGVKPSRPSTCFPSAVTMAGSWNDNLLFSVGQAIGEEALAQNVGLVLGPGINIKRSPLCGRNFEYYSEDQYLSGKLAAAFIRGLEGTGAAACVKHFAANSQESERFTSNSVVDERTLREIYLTAFEIAVKEGKPSAVMCAYNMINGVYCSDNKWLLTDVLRKEWGFDGMVVTDWGAMHDRVAAFTAGCDLDMPGGHHYGEREARRALKRGELDEEHVRASAQRVIDIARRARKALSGSHVFDVKAHHEIARRAACEGAVLLKNEGAMLPIKPGTPLAVIGDMARNMRYQGSGSSHINPLYLTQPLDNLPYTIYSQGCDSEGNTDDELISRACVAARGAAAAVIFAGLPDSYESEGFDRENMKLPSGMNRLISAVVKVNPNVCVVLFCGSPVECPWADEVRAILYMGLPGQAGGEAAADLLYGRAEPSGRLAESWPFQYSDTPASAIYAKSRDALYEEGVYVGYRYYATSGKNVRWPFGHGLGYSTFEYSNIRAEGFDIYATVRNIGTRRSSAVAQLYVSPPRSGVHRPALELKGYKKVCLNPGESWELKFELTGRSFAFWQDGWRVQDGEYKILVGPSSADLPLSTVVHVDGERDIPVPESQRGSWYESLAGKPDRASLEAATGYKYEPYVPQKGKFTLNDTPYDLKKDSLIMSIIYHGIDLSFRLRYGSGRERKPEARMMFASSALAPLRMMQINGRVPGILLRSVLFVANGFK